MSCAWAQLSLSVAPGPRQRHGGPGQAEGARMRPPPDYVVGPRAL